MNDLQRLEAQLLLLQKRIATLEAQVGPKMAGNVHDESVARGVVMSFGGDWEVVKRGGRDARSCLARACAVDALVNRGEWSQRRVAVVMGMSHQAVKKSLRRLPGRLGNQRGNDARRVG